MSITSKPFGKLPDGREATLYTMTNRLGASVSITDFGGIVTSIRVPDKEGFIGEVALGYEDVAPYLTPRGSMGITVGRYANRIGKGRFTLNGITYQLTLNDGNNHLHGGPTGFGSLLWEASTEQTQGMDTLILRLVSPDGHEQYPGTLTLTVRYSWNDNCDLIFAYHAETDKDTVINLTNHAYFNLAGDESGSVLGHELTIHSQAITETDDELIPTGRILPVAGTPFDFTTAKTIGDGLATPGHWKTIEDGMGYDCNFILGKFGEMREAVLVHEPVSGRRMTVYTDQPAVQLYGGNRLEFPGRTTGRYDQYGGFCLETQHYPDAPNHSDFPTTVLKAGDVFKSVTTYTFRCDGE